MVWEYIEKKLLHFMADKKTGTVDTVGSQGNKSPPGALPVPHSVLLLIMSPPYKVMNMHPLNNKLS